MLELNKIHNGDCLELMKEIPTGSIDCIICDLPFGTTYNPWDLVIPFEKLWSAYKRIIKENGNIILFGSQPFSSELVCSNKKWFKYEIIWEKNINSNFLNAKKQFLKHHENILLFNQGTGTYNPQGLIPIEPKVHSNKSKKRNYVMGAINRPDYIQHQTNYPKSILKFDVERGGKYGHGTKKPVKLIEYLIRTFSNEGETVLDNCSGSGTLAIAAINTNRKFICIEKDVDIFNLSIDRIKEHQKILAENEVVMVDL